MGSYGLCVIRLIALLKGELRNITDNILLWLPVFQSVGVLSYFSLKDEPDRFLISILIIVVVLLLALIIANNKLAPVFIIVFVIMGFLCAYFRTAALLVENPIVTSKTYLKDMVGTLSELNNYKHRYMQLLLCGIDGWEQEKTCIRLAVRTAIDPIIKVGDLVKFSGVAYPPGASTPSNGHDFARTAYFRCIVATGFATSNIVLHRRAQKLGFWHTIEKIRIKIYEGYLSGLNRDTAEIISALIIGKRSGISEEVLENVRNSGLAHLLAISGLHLSFVAGMAFVFFRHVFSCSEKLTLSYNTKKLCAVIATITSFCYLLLAGMPIPACRAFVMVAMMFFGIVVDRRHDSMRSISAAASIILFCSPESILSPSFQMSFVAVVALVSFGNIPRVLVPASSVSKYVLSTVVSSFIASIATAPYVLYHFHTFSVAGVVANVIAIPLVTFIIVPLAAAYQIVCTTSSCVVAYVLERSVSLLLHVAKYAAMSEWSSFHFRAISGCSVFTVSVGFLIICYSKGIIRIVFGSIVVFCGLALVFDNNTPDVISDGSVVVVKGLDSKLYLALRVGSARKLKYSQWAKDNGQEKMLIRSKNAEDKSQLWCGDGGCMYSNRVLIACKNEFLIRHCKNADIVIYNGDDKYPEECADTRYIDLGDFHTYGVHYIRLHEHAILVDRAITTRPWHRNLRGLASDVQHSTTAKNKCVVVQ
ncbi:MAG: ComEC/Rec2 family competence protein [Aaplasma endosymbiont of Hyalomma asiaticum]